MDSVCEGGARAAIAPTHVEHGERRSAHGAVAEEARARARFTQKRFPRARHRSVNGLLISGVTERAPHFSRRCPTRAPSWHFRNLPLSSLVVPRVRGARNMTARPDSRLRRLISDWHSPFLPRKSLLDWHDDWNLVALGALNVAQLSWWCGLVSGPAVLNALFVADALYLIADTMWLLFFPECVPARARPTLLMHHCTICFAIPMAAGRPVLMRHMLRTWIVEVHSWNHIATRRLRSERLASFCRDVNKPLFVAIRLVAFPLTWFSYSSERLALPTALLEAQAPIRVHAPLSLAQLALYGLMLKWGYDMLVKS